MRYEQPTWQYSYFGTFGVLADDGYRVQCHICGDWWDALWTHARYSHGLTAADYRRAFGLAQSNKLAGPTFRQKRRALHTEMLRNLEVPRSTHDNLRGLTL
jgi:predicted transcriptional regulator